MNTYFVKGFNFFKFMYIIVSVPKADSCRDKTLTINSNTSIDVTRMRKDRHTTKVPWEFK